MAQQFYQQEILTLIRTNQLLKNQLKLLKNHTSKLITSFLSFFNNNFKPKDGLKTWDKFMGLKEGQLVTLENMAKLVEMIEGIRWMEVRAKRDECDRRDEQDMEGRVVGKVQQMLAQYMKVSSASFNYLSLMEENKQNLCIIKQLQMSLNNLTQQQQSKNKTIQTLKSISKQLQNELIESNYIHEVQRRALKEEIAKYKQQVQRLNRQLKKLHYSYDKLCQSSSDRLGVLEEQTLDRSRGSKR